MIKSRVEAKIITETVTEMWRRKRHSASLQCVRMIACSLPMDYYYYYYYYYYYCCFDGRRSLTLISPNQIYLPVLFAELSAVKLLSSCQTTAELLWELSCPGQHWR